MNHSSQDFKLTPPDIVPAQFVDLPEILNLQYQAYQSEARLFSNPRIPPLCQTLPELQEEFRKGTIVLKALDEHGVMVGSVRYAQEGRNIRIGKLIVRPDRQGHGIGTALLRAVEQRCPGMRFELFTSSRSTQNLSLYERLGYREFQVKKVTEELQFIYLEKCSPADSAAKKRKTVAFLLLEPYADWEAAPLASAITALGEQVLTLSPEGKDVRSLGGFTTHPDQSCSLPLPESCAGIVLIGGMSWRSSAARCAVPLLREALDRNLVIGAICDAVSFLGTQGILNDIPHTGNQVSDLKEVGGARYSGESFYRNEPAVRGGSIVTANGTAPLEFAREMLTALGLFTENEAARWYRLFHSGIYQAPEDAVWWFSRLSAN